MPCRVRYCIAADGSDACGTGDAHRHTLRSKRGWRECWNPSNFLSAGCRDSPHLRGHGSLWTCTGSQHDQPTVNSLQWSGAQPLLVASGADTAGPTSCDAATGDLRRTRRIRGLRGLRLGATGGTGDVGALHRSQDAGDAGDAGDGTDALSLHQGVSLHRGAEISAISTISAISNPPREAIPGFTESRKRKVAGHGCWCGEVVPRWGCFGCFGWHKPMPTDTWRSNPDSSWFIRLQLGLWYAMVIFGLININFGIVKEPSLVPWICLDLDLQGKRNCVPSSRLWNKWPGVKVNLWSSWREWIPLDQPEFGRHGNPLATWNQRLQLGAKVSSVQ